MVKLSQGVWAATQSSMFALLRCLLWTGHAGPVGGSQLWSHNKSNMLLLWFVSFFPLWSSRRCHRGCVLHHYITKGPKDDTASLENQTSGLEPRWTWSLIQVRRNAHLFDVICQKNKVQIWRKGKLWGLKSRLWEEIDLGDVSSPG